MCGDWRSKGESGPGRKGARGTREKARARTWADTSCKRFIASRVRILAAVERTWADSSETHVASQPHRIGLTARSGRSTRGSTGRPDGPTAPIMVKITMIGGPDTSACHAAAAAAAAAVTALFRRCPPPSIVPRACTTSVQGGEGGDAGRGEGEEHTPPQMSAGALI